MNDKIDNLFAKLKRVNEPPDIQKRITTAIFEKKLKRERWFIGGTYGAIMASIIFLFFTVNMLITDFSNSETGSLARILISDFGAVRQNLFNWILALLESVSLDGLLLTTFGIFVLVISINTLVTLLRLKGRKVVKKWPNHILHSF